METRNVFIQVIKKPARKHGFTLLRATASPPNKFKHLFSRAHLLNPYASYKSLLKNIFLL